MNILINISDLKHCQEFDLLEILTNQFIVSVTSFGNCEILRFSNLFLSIVKVCLKIVLKVGKYLLYN